MRHARKDVVAAASAKRLHALLSAGVKQLGKEILLDEMHGFVGQV